MKEEELRVMLERVLQRLESHGEGCCHLDARDRKAIKDAHILLGNVK